MMNALMREHISTHITKMLGEQGIWGISPFIFFRMDAQQVKSGLDAGGGVVSKE